MHMEIWISTLQHSVLIVLLSVVGAPKHSSRRHFHVALFRSHMYFLFWIVNQKGKPIITAEREAAVVVCQELWRQQGKNRMWCADRRMNTTRFTCFPNRQLLLFILYWRQFRLRQYRLPVVFLHKSQVSSVALRNVALRWTCVQNIFLSAFFGGCPRRVQTLHFSRGGIPLQIRRRIGRLQL